MHKNEKKKDIIDYYEELGAYQADISEEVIKKKFDHIKNQIEWEFQNGILSQENLINRISQLERSMEETLTILFARNSHEQEEDAIPAVLLPEFEKIFCDDKKNHSLQTSPHRRKFFSAPSSSSSEPLLLKKAFPRPKAANALHPEKSQILKSIIEKTPHVSGHLLRTLRESLNVEIPEMSSRTKISTIYLNAMETNEADRLPADVYLRGFLCSYLTYLGVEKKELVDALLKFYKNRRSTANAS